MNSNDSTYSSDRKLNFLCSLDLFPTPLIKKCPNATKRWLRAVPNVSVVQDIGINAQYEIDHSPNKIDFIAVSMVDATENTENNLIFSNLSTEHTGGDSTAKVTPLMNKSEHTAFEFDKEKCIYTFSDQCSMETLTATIPSYVSNGTVSQKTMSGIDDEKLGDERSILQNRDHGGLEIQHISVQDACKNIIVDHDMQNVEIDDVITPGINQNIFTISPIGKPMLNTNEHLPELLSTAKQLEDINDKEYRCTFSIHSVNGEQQSLETEHVLIQEPPKKNKINRDLQDIVLNEIITQEINQTIFAKATIGKTQGYLSELLRTSKLLEEKSEKEYRRTRHNLEKIKQFLKKPKYERKRIYDEISRLKDSISHDKQQEKQKRTVLSVDVKNYLSEYFYSHHGKICNEDYQLLSSHLKLDLQNVKIFHKNWKQRTKIKVQ